MTEIQKWAFSFVLVAFAMYGWWTFSARYLEPPLTRAINRLRKAMFVDPDTR